MKWAPVFIWVGLLIFGLSVTRGEAPPRDQTRLSLLTVPPAVPLDLDRFAPPSPSQALPPQPFSKDWNRIYEGNRAIRQAGKDPDNLLKTLAPLIDEFPEHAPFQLARTSALFDLGRSREAEDRLLTLLEKGVLKPGPRFTADPTSLLPEAVQSFFQFCEPTHYHFFFDRPPDEDRALLGPWLRWNLWDQLKLAHDSGPWNHRYTLRQLLARSSAMEAPTRKRLVSVLEVLGIERPDLLMKIYAAKDPRFSYFRIPISLVEAHPEDLFLGTLWLYAGITECDPYIATQSNWNTSLATHTLDRLAKARPQLAALLGLLAARYLPEAQTLVQLSLIQLEAIRQPHEDLVQALLQALATHHTQFPNHLNKDQRRQLLAHLIRWIPNLLLEEPPKWPFLRAEILSICEASQVDPVHYRILKMEARLDR